MRCPCIDCIKERFLSGREWGITSCSMERCAVESCEDRSNVAWIRATNCLLRPYYQGFLQAIQRVSSDLVRDFGLHKILSGLSWNRCQVWPPISNIHTETQWHILQILYILDLFTCNCKYHVIHNRTLRILSASLYFSKRGAYWDRLCRDVVGRWSLVCCHARALWPINGAS